ncbi:unnamed protein product [Absidia cylindrospora]
MIQLSKSMGIPLVLLLVMLFFIHIRLEKRLMNQSTKYGKNMDTASITPFQPDEEKFITYLPHSGLHNQRIALINSIILAKALNRTLIMPELNLGTATYWRPSAYLPYRLDECGDKHVVTSHKKTADGKPWWSPNCFDYRNYLPMAVETIFDLNGVHQMGVKTIQRRDMQLDYFSRYWSIPMDERNQTLAYQVMDNSRYSYQIVDDPLIGENTKFVERYTLDQLGQHQETFLIFNSLFGSDRLALRSDKWVQAREYLRKEIGVRQPWVMNSSLDIVGKLGGPGSFISVHIRMGDGIFKKMMDETMERVRQQLIQRQTDTNDDEISNDHQEQIDATIAHINSLQGQPQNRLTACLQIQQQNQQNRSCVHHRLGMIYMTTDAVSPLKTLPHLFEEFVCLFTLDDFKNIVDDTIALRPALLDHRHQHHPEETNSTNTNTSSLPPTTKGNILLPLIDAEIASQASFFVPTPKSTFSGYIGYRNKRFQRLYMNNASSTI